MVREEPEVGEVLIDCPKCGAWMKLNRPQAGADWDQPFYGCTQFPKCKGTRELTQLGEPISDAELKEREDIKAEIKWEKKHGKVGADPVAKDDGIRGEEGGLWGSGSELRTSSPVASRGKRDGRIAAGRRNNGRVRLTLSRIRKPRSIRRMIFEFIFERGKHGRQR